MATASDLYTRCLVKIEKNGTNDNVSFDYSRFVYIANEAFIKFVEKIYDDKNSDEIRYIQNLLVEEKLSQKDKEEKYTSFSLPKNFLNHSSVNAKVSNDSCKTSTDIELFEIKDIDRDVILNDEFNKPSFKYREAPYTFSDNSLKIFTDDFKIDEVLLNYYRYPREIKLIDDDDPEQGLDDSFSLDFDEKSLNIITSLIAKDFDINTSNERFQLQELRQQK